MSVKTKILKKQIKMHLMDEKGAPWSGKVETVGLLLLMSVFFWGVAVHTYRDLCESNRIVLTNDAEASWGVRDKDEVRDEAPQKTESADGISAYSTIKRIAREKGIDWRILVALFQKESTQDCSRIGDKHLPTASYGCYQIILGYHPNVTKEQAMSLKWSTEWTANRLKKNEWRGRHEMIRSHNGLVEDHHNDGYVDDVEKIIIGLND